MNIRDFLTVSRTDSIDIASIVTNDLDFSQRLALVKLICEELNTDESIEEIRKVVNASSLDD